MKYIAALALAFSASAAAFAPLQTQNVGRPSTARDAIFDSIIGMDLFAPVKDQNNYGARAKKNVKLGSLSDKSYIPTGMSKADYDRIRKSDKDKKDKNYAGNVGKAFQFTDYTEWYTKRGTDVQAAWKKDVNLGHRMAKTKWDWSGTADAKQIDSSVKPKPPIGIFGKKTVSSAKPTTPSFSFFGKKK
jgi:hypothetical protein